MNEEMLNKLLPYLDKIGEKLNESGAKLWQIAQAQVKVNMLTDIILLGFLLIAFVGNAIAIHQFFKKNKVVEGELFSIIFWASAVELIIFIILLVLIPYRLPEILTAVYNPDYAALKILFSMLRIQ